MRILFVSAIFFLLASCSSTEHLSYSKRLPPEVSREHMKEPLEIKPLVGDRGDELRMDLIKDLKNMGFDVYFSDEKESSQKNILRGGVVYDIQLKEETNDGENTTTEKVSGVARGNFTLVDGSNKKVLWSDRVLATKSLGSYLTSQEEHPKFAVYTYLKDAIRTGVIEKFKGKTLNVEVPFIGAESGERLHQGYLFAKRGKYQKAINFYKKQLQENLSDEERSSLYINLASAYILNQEKESAVKMMNRVTTPEIYRSEVEYVRSALSQL